MALADLSDREAVLAATREYDRVGAAVFLAQHGYEPSRRYLLEVDGRSYPSKAIAGVAHGYQFPRRGPLRASQFSGGEATVVRVLGRLGFHTVDLDSDAGSYWWDGDRAERYWVEIRRAEGIGRSLICPAPPEDGTSHNAWYQLVGEVQPEDVVYHWNAVEHRFVGRSRAASAVRHEGDEWIVELSDFVPLRVSVDLDRVRDLAPKLTEVRDRLATRFGHPLYLPFQYRGDGLRLMSNYFAKLPADAVTVLFDATELGEARADPPAVEDGSAVEADVPSSARTGFLAPFRPKADADYVARLPGGVQRRGRKHESLVNGFAAWLEARGFEVGRNAAVDLGLARPPVVIEAKIVTRWPDVIRAAVGQLYEYRYFKVADPSSSLVILASEPVPMEWLRYLERDRRIGAAWPEGDTFVLSSLAQRSFGHRLTTAS